MFRSEKLPKLAKDWLEIAGVAVDTQRLSRPRTERVTW